MKYIITIAIITISILLTSCSHNAELLSVGTAFRIGSGEASINYADGLFLNSVSRDNMRFSAELDSTVGVTFDPSSNSYKGIKSISYEIGPQLGGYSKELGEKNPEALKSYYDATAEYYKYRSAKDAAPAANKQAISNEKSKDATSKIMDAVKQAIDKFKSKGEEGASSEPFDCKDGNCDLDNLDSISLRTFQTAVANKLMTYADDTTKFEGEETTLKKSLQMFLRRMEQYKAKGIDEVRIRVRRASVRNNVLKSIRYVYYDDDRTFETNCPECVFIPEIDMGDK